MNEHLINKLHIKMIPTPTDFCFQYVRTDYVSITKCDLCSDHPAVYDQGQA